MIISCLKSLAFFMIFSIFTISDHFMLKTIDPRGLLEAVDGHGGRLDVAHGLQSMKPWEQCWFGETNNSFREPGQGSREER